jgi:hypothetical protein
MVKVGRGTQKPIYARPNCAIALGRGQQIRQRVYCPSAADRLCNSFGGGIAEAVAAPVGEDKNPLSGRGKQIEPHPVILVRTAYDANVGSQRVNCPVRRQCGKEPTPPLAHHRPTNPVATLRPERGNWVAKCDGSSVKPPKPLRPHFGTKCDSNLGQNLYSCSFNEVIRSSFGSCCRTYSSTCG